MAKQISRTIGVVSFLVLLPSICVSQPTISQICSDFQEFESQYTKPKHEIAEVVSDFLDSRIAVETDQESVLYDPSLLKRLYSSIELAECFSIGPLDRRDNHKAMAILQSPAEAGNKTAIHSLASLQVFATDNRRLQEVGFETLKKEANAGSAYSTGKLGKAYALGRGTKRDPEKALENYFKAARAGMTYWQYLLAHSYEHGYYGLPIDEEQAKYWRELQPKTHYLKYECVIAGDYKLGIFPRDEELLEKFTRACNAEG